MRPDLDVNADDRFVQVSKIVKAGVAQGQAKLVFTLGPETAVAFVAGGILRMLQLLFGVNFGMNFQRGHENAPGERWASHMPVQTETIHSIQKT